MFVNISLESPDHDRLARALAAHPWLAPSSEFPRVEAEVDSRKVPAPPDWPSLFDGRNLVSLVWEDATGINRRQIRVLPEIVTLALDWKSFSVARFHEEIASLPFEVATVNPIYRWKVPGKPREGYTPPSFGNGHYYLGPVCAFQGAGHQRLVSPRWLDYGPWLVRRDQATDTTVVQFHEEGVDARTALDQARPGHARMAGNTSDASGFIPAIFRVESALTFFYHRDARQMRVVVAEGVDVTRQQMHDACVIRFHNQVDPDRFAPQREPLALAAAKFGPQPGQAQRFPPDEPFDNIAFVFVTDDDARRHLHELWLRSLECWSMEGGGMRRLDDSYQPPPPVEPAWVTRAAAQT